MKLTDVQRLAQIVFIKWELRAEEVHDLCKALNEVLCRYSTG